MKASRRTVVLTAVLALAGGLELTTKEAWAQANTYADFPYNQGSLFYRYKGPGSKPRTTRRARPAPRVYYPTTTAPRQPVYLYANTPQAGYYYVQPQYQIRPGVVGGWR